jgi:hypothetical protein
MSREELLWNWLKYVSQIIRNYFIMQGAPIDERKLFHYNFPVPLWERIRSFIRNFSVLPVWLNTSLSSTVFGGKQNYEYWQCGKTPQGQQVLAEPTDEDDMSRSSRLPTGLNGAWLGCEGGTLCPSGAGVG